MPNEVMEQMRAAFSAEALDLLIELDSALLTLESRPGDMALVHRVFRAIHTIKGSGATAGFKVLAKFTHNVEEAFDLAREGKLAVTSELIDCALRACDVIRIMIEEHEPPVVAGQADVTNALAKLLGVSKEAPNLTPEPTKTVESGVTAYQIILKPHSGIFYAGAEPVTLLDELRGMGQVHIRAHTEDVPPFDALNPEHCYLWWEVLLVSENGRGAVENVFEFVAGTCTFQVRVLDDQLGAVALLGSVPADILELFQIESDEHLTQIEKDVLILESQPNSRISLDSLFRSVHSIKGNCQMLLGQIKSGALQATHPLQIMGLVAHSLESLLDPFRQDVSPVLAETVQTTLKACDSLRNCLGSLTRESDVPYVTAELAEKLGIASHLAVVREPGNGREAAFLNTTTQCIEMIGDCLNKLQGGVEPVHSLVEIYFRGLKTLSAAAQYRKCAALEEPVAVQLRILEASMATGAALSNVERAALGSAFEDVVAAVEQLTTKKEALSSLIVHRPDNPPTTENISTSSSSTIRIEQAKLDRLMRGVGELLVARGAFPLLVQKLNTGVQSGGLAKDLKEAGSNISRIADELQASLMSIRMLPVKTVFQRFPRLVRDLARSLGKEVRLVVEGEGIELDKTILEQIGDPLVHVIRNSVDHGLETPDERRAAGKDTTGQVKLKASHVAGGVVIEIADDGRGLNAEALRRKAREKGLITAEAAAAMSDEAAFQLIFAPGLSTAAKLTDVSGRGVGMDVVRSNVRNLQGNIEIKSKLGKGTTLLITLPTSLMISKGILMEAGGSEYIMPLSNIRDMVKMPRDRAHEYRGSRIAQIRGNVYSLFTLAEALGLRPKQTEQLSVALVEAGESRYGLVVDRFVTEVEVLVKPLSGGLANCKEFQGAAIMGDGRVVLVLNPMECHSSSLAAVGLIRD